MKVVTPQTRTTLLLNDLFQPFAFCTARAAIRHLITDKAKGIDADGMVVSFGGQDHDKENNWSQRSWYGNKVALFDDQPALRSAPNTITGEETVWAIPTILVTKNHFGSFNRHSGKSLSLRKLYGLYKGQCQYCLEKIPFSLATRDHVYPKSKGGSNDDFNSVLACKPCNNSKDNIFPYYDINGNAVKPKRMSPVATLIEGAPAIREEWKLHLFQS